MMRKLCQFVGCFAAAASILAIDARAADLSSTFQWPWSQPDPYADIPTYDWSGGYIALMGGYNSTTITQGDLASTMVDRTVPSWKWASEAKALAKASALDLTASAGIYSLHAGINMMSQRVVYGVELEYGKFAPAMNASGYFQQTRIVDTTTKTNSAGQDVVDKLGVSVEMTNRTQILDFGLLNARAGYAYGRFMPYALVGLGVTRVKVDAVMNAGQYHDITVNGVRAPISDASTSTNAFIKNAYAATVSLGLGFEYALLDNVLLRAQYNYMTSGNVKGEGLSNNMARGGLALKF